MGGPHGQKSVWATAHTDHTVPAPMVYVTHVVDSLVLLYIWRSQYGFSA